MKMPQNIVAGAFCAVLVAVSAPAHAHAYLEAANPAVDATVPAPKRIVLQMSEKIFPKFSGFAVSSKLGRVPVTVTVVNEQMIGIPTKPLKPGAYEVKWHAVGSDTHRLEGKYNFTVR